MIPAGLGVYANTAVSDGEAGAKGVPILTDAVDDAEMSLVNGLLTPDQIRALNEADMNKLVLILLIILTPLFISLAILIIRSSRQNQKERNAIETSRIAGETAREEREDKKSQFQQELTLRLALALDKLVDEAKQDRDSIEENTKVLDLLSIEIGGIPAKAASAIQAAHQPIAAQFEKTLGEVDKVSRDSQQLITDQIEAIGRVAKRVNELPTAAEIQKTVQQEVTSILSEIGKLETTLVGIKTNVVIMLDKLMQIPIVKDALEVDPTKGVEVQA